MSASRPALTNLRAARWVILVSKHVMVVIGLLTSREASRLVAVERRYQPAARPHKWCCPYSSGRRPAW